MPLRSKPTLLENLRRQSDEMRARETAARQPFEAAVKAIDSGLWRAFRWLDEALGHLEVIRPAAAHVFKIGFWNPDSPRQFDRQIGNALRVPLGFLVAQIESM